MSHTISIFNNATHSQTFQIHNSNWNGGADLTVDAQSWKNISNVADGQSGAILAVHNGQAMEQVEITKGGFGGNDYLDISDIVGAAGNLVVWQTPYPESAKGDPLFMQHLTKGWLELNGTMQGLLKDFVFLTDDNKRVDHIGSTKSSSLLEDFVRAAAGGKSYIGIGAWDGVIGNTADNDQSSGGKGSTDIIITYSDYSSTGESSSSSGSDSDAKASSGASSADSSTTTTEKASSAASSDASSASSTAADSTSSDSSASSPASSTAADSTSQASSTAADNTPIQTTLTTKVASKPSVHDDAATSTTAPQTSASLPAGEYVSVETVVYTKPVVETIWGPEATHDAGVHARDAHKHKHGHKHGHNHAAVHRRRRNGWF